MTFCVQVVGTRETAVCPCVPPRSMSDSRVWLCKSPLCVCTVRACGQTRRASRVVCVCVCGVLQQHHSTYADLPSLTPRVYVVACFFLWPGASNCALKDNPKAYHKLIMHLCCGPNAV